MVKKKMVKFHCLPKWLTRPELSPVSVAWQLGVLLLPPGWDASPSQGYPQQYVAGTHLETWEKRDNVEQSFLSKGLTTQQ